MYVQRATIKNFRCFEEAEVTFECRAPESDADASHDSTLDNVTVILGDNGSGKSAILKAIAIGLLYPVLPSSGFRPFLLVRRTTQDPDLTIDDVAVTTVEVGLHAGDYSEFEFTPGTRFEFYGMVSRFFGNEKIEGGGLQQDLENILFDPDDPTFFVVAYGTGRRVETNLEFSYSSRVKSRHPRYLRVASLFEDDVALVPVSTWRHGEGSTRHRGAELSGILNSVLPDGIRFCGVDGAPDEEFNVDGVGLPFSALSDGHRSFIGWIVDLIFHLAEVSSRGTALTEQRGLVMVDEIDDHLHPLWQRTVIPSLAKAFPNLQFIFTTHSPIVAGSVYARNIRVAEREDGKAVIRQFTERVNGLSPDQILTGPYFGMTSTRASSAEARLHALTQKAWDGDEEAAIEYLRRLREGFDSADVA